MKRLFSLVKVMLKSSIQSMSSLDGMRIKKTDSKKKKAFALVGAILLLAYLFGIIFVPTQLLVKQFVKLGQPSTLISLLYAIAPVMILYFAFLSIPGIFYFSKDINNYLPLPFTSLEIITSKFITAYVSTFVTTAFIFLPIYINYFTFVSPGVLYILTSLLSLLILPLIPLAIAMIIVAVLMRFVPFLKNKNLFIYVSMGLVFIPTMILVMSMSGVDTDADMIEAITTAILNMDDSLFREISLFFPTSKMLTLGAIDNNFIQLFLAAFISLVISAVSILVVKTMYFESVIGIDEHVSKKRKLRLTEMDHETKVSSFTKSFMVKDFKNILRTPAFLMNYFSMFLVLPILGLIPIFTQKNGIQGFMEILKGLSELFHTYFETLSGLDQIQAPLLAGLALGVVIAALEASNSTAISREGLALRNYLTFPIRLSDITHAKARLSLSVSSIYITVIMILGILVLRPGVLIFILFFVSTIIGLMLITYVSILVDVLFPSLNWETEQQAVKGNFVQVLVMLPALFLPLLIVAAFFFTPALLNILVVLMALPLLTGFIILETTKASNTRLLNKIQKT